MSTAPAAPVSPELAYEAVSTIKFLAVDAARHGVNSRKGHGLAEMRPHVQDLGRAIQR